MPSTVEIVVKGIALWYQKEDVHWNALLPFDDCHIVDFSVQVNEGRPTNRRSLARKKGKVRIYREGGVQGLSSSTPAFDQQVLDLTSVEPYLTHDRVRIKDDDKWDDSAVHLQIESIELTVFDYVEDITDEPLLLHGSIMQLQRLDSMAHWVKGTIVIPDGETLKVESNDREIASLPGNGRDDYRIVINNDCHRLSDKNDMLKYYEVITGYDADDTSEEFWVGEKNPVPPGVQLESNTAIESLAQLSKIDILKALVLIYKMFTGNASLAAGKPCMNVRVSKADDLPDF